MRHTHIVSILLFFAILILTVFLSGKQINSKIEESIRSNYEKDILALKEKLDKHSELMNSIISINNKTENAENSSTAQEEATSTDGLEFEYTKEANGITITKYIGKKINVTIPNKIEGLPVLKINEKAFSDSKIKSITLPSYCTEIDWFAFYGCFALSTVYIPSSVEIIGYGAFDGCSKALTIYCENQSYAEKYAQSFGINYSEIQ